MDLAGRPIVITGGGTGIGAAAAQACAAAGMPVCIAGRRAEPLQRIVAAIKDAGGQCIGMPLDVTDADHAAMLLDAATEAFGPPWAVFANAGRGLDRLAHRTTEAELRELFEVNFFATCRLLNIAADRMLDAQSGGHLLACSSCVAKFSVPYHAAYAATKASQDLYCQSMRLELVSAGIHVSTVHPITTTTEFFDVSAGVSGRSDAPTGLDLTPRWFQQSPERVAKAIVKCLRKPRPEVWTSKLVRMTSAIRTLWPTVMDWQFRRMLDADRLHRGS